MNLSMSDLTLENCLDIAIVQANVKDVPWRGVRIALWSEWWEGTWDWALVCNSFAQ